MFRYDFLKLLSDECFTAIGGFIGHVDVDNLLLKLNILVKLLFEIAERVIECVLPELCLAVFQDLLVILHSQIIIISSFAANNLSKLYIYMLTSILRLLSNKS